jgi:hypothetical protein
MRVSKNQITLLSAAVSALFAVGAQAQNVLLSSSNPTVSASTARVYVSETNNNTPIATTGFNVNTILGIGTSSNQQRYVKYTLTNATFQSAVLGNSITNVVINANTVTTNTITPTVAFGGAAGTNSVIFQITTPNGANIVDGIQFNIIGGVNVTSAPTTATITYEVYEFLSDAQSAPTKVLYGPRTGNIASFASGYRFQNNSTSLPTQVATSLSGFLSFNNGASGSSAIAANQALLGLLDIVITPNSTTTFLPNGTAIGALTDILGASGSQVTVTGDFSAAAAANNAITLNSVNAVGGTPFNATTVVFNIDATTFGVNKQLRYTTNGTSQIVAVPSYSASLSAAPNGTTFKTTTASISSIGSVTRDGSTYESPWASATPGYLSRYFLTQTSGATVTWSAIVRSPNGPVTGGTTNGTLVSGQVSQITLASLLPTDTSALVGPFQVTFTIAADSSQVRGTYVISNTNTGTTSVVPLYRTSAQ